MQVLEIMKKDPICVTGGMTVREAARLMEEVACGILPVVHDRQSAQPLGVITDRDIVLRCVAKGSACDETRVSEVQTRDIIICDEGASVSDAFERMRTEKVGRLLVTDAQGNLTGIVTMADIIARVPREIFNQLPGAERAQPRRAA